MGVSRFAAVRATIVGLVSTALLTGCSAPTPAGAPAAPRTAFHTESTPSPVPTPATQPPRTEKWIGLKAGDCLAGLPSADPAVVTVTVVDCDTPHLAEAYLRADIPVNGALTDVANTKCADGFTEYTKAPAGGSPYSVTYLIDSDQDRTANNPYPSTVICLLQGSQGQALTGSARR